ncbi:MAG: FkbM family methyltransferase [Acidobacteria bacterium]|nr:FkbM family methyltransferase [Acidobacteriota bacterium]
MTALQRFVNQGRKVIPRGWVFVIKAFARFIPSLQHYRVSLVNGDHMYLDLREDMCFGQFFDGCISGEQGTDTLFNRLLHKGAVVIDVGANIGYYTRIASNLVGQEGQVLAFEPSPKALSVLKLNTGDLGNVQIFPVALSDSEGEVRFYVRKNGGTSSLSADSGAQQVLVKMTTLDHLPINVQQVDFIKIDVEGFEPDVLRGAQSVIKRFRPIVYLEYFEHYAEQRGFASSVFDSFFSDLDYELYWVDERAQDTHLISKTPSNYIIAIPKERRQLVASLS